MNFFNNFNVGKKIIIGYITILTLMIMVTTVLLFSLNNVTKEFNFLVKHDQPVLSNIYLLEKLVVDMETGERGFLITGKDEFLEPYHNGVTKFNELLEVEKQLVSDNPSQVAALEEIARLHDKWIKVAAQPEIAKRREANKATVNADYLQEVLKKGVGKGILDKLRKVLERLEVDLSKNGELSSVILVIKIAKDMVDQETGQRGFIITGADNFLEPYYSGQTQLVIDIAALRQQLTTSNDLNNLVLLTQVETLANEWLEKAAKLEIAARQKMNTNSVTMNDISNLIQAGVGKNILDTMRDRFLIFSKIETNLNLQRIENAEQNIKIVEVVTVIFTLITVFIGLIFGVYISRNITHPLIKLTEMANKIANGNINQVLSKQNRLDMSYITVRQDEMGKIGRAYDSLANCFGGLIADIVQVSQKLADGNLLAKPKIEYKGDFVQIKNALELSIFNFQQVVTDIVQVSQSLAEGSQNVIAKAEYKGDFIQIKNALETAADKLATANTNKITQDWIKTGQSKFNELIRGEQDINLLAKNVITFLCKYLQAQVGLFYLLKDREQTPYLQIISAYAYVNDAQRPNKYLIGEGLVGQVALEKETLVFKQSVDECPTIICSGLTNVMPFYSLLLPCLYENEVTAVIEIGLQQEPSETQHIFLNQLMPSVGIAINTAHSRSRTQHLLQQSQQQSEELQTQQEELQKTNGELQTQQEELQTQQEELRQTNEVLEEQTRSLEQQKVTVQEKNIALEQSKARMEKAQVEMVKVQEAIAAKAKELELASRYKSEFLANMSHELRTPLNSLLILSQLLSDNKSENLNEKQIEYAKTINSAGKDLLTLINDILDLSKVEAGKIEISWEKIKLNDLLSMIKQKFLHIAEDKSLGFEITIADNIPKILISDGQRIKQIINNLLSNAFKFTSAGKIQLLVKYPTEVPINIEGNKLELSKTIAISVVDSGIGIPKDKQQVVFEAFQQVDGSTSRRYGGTGLGLSISRQLARLMGGELALESQLDKGSTFTLYLPEKESIDSTSIEILPQKNILAPIAEISTEKVSSEPVLIRDDRNNLQDGDKILLIVEDDSNFSNILMDLARDNSFKCLLAEDGVTGLMLTEKYKPCAIILDVNLPQLDGWRVMEKLKDNSDTRHIPVHFISGADKVIDAKKLGAIGYLLKPASVEKLEAAFQQIADFLSKTVKKLLVVTNVESYQQDVIKLVKVEEIQIQQASTVEKALQILQTTKYDCIILDLAVEQGSDSKLLATMSKNKERYQTPVIVYINRDLTTKEKNLLANYSSKMPVKLVNSSKRLLDEVTLFLHQVIDELPDNKRDILKMIHDKTAIVRNKKVLLVDDDMRNSFALTTILEDYEMEVVVAENGKAGLKQLEKHDDIAIILMDIMMPEMDGYEAMRNIRQQTKYRKLPIIALTAKAMKDDKIKCIEAGANDYLSKPVDTDKLLSLMRVWLYR
ncbi:MAG: CHASE3 domain-containing protein [Thiomargarita sp.]|nr:CHASE3 domain-containing protein [Thiomargarita sp.]